MCKMYLSILLLGIILSPVITKSTDQLSSCSPDLLRFCTCDPIGDFYDITCRGYDIVNISRQLPANTARFQYTAMEVIVYLGSADFTHLMHLKTLAVQDPGDFHKILERKIYPLEKGALMLGNRSSLLELRININWQTQTKLPDLFKGLENLEVIDFSNTRWLDIDILIDSLQAMRNYTNMKVLNLWNIKTMQHSSSNLKFELGKVLEPLSNSKLEVLNIGYNSFRSVSPGLIEFAPHLKKLIARNNVLIPILTCSLMTEVFLHKALEEADFSEQGFRPVSDSPINMFHSNTQDSLGVSSFAESNTMIQRAEFKGQTHRTSKTGDHIYPNSFNYRIETRHILDVLYLEDKRLKEILLSSGGLPGVRSLEEVIKFIKEQETLSDSDAITVESQSVTGNPNDLPDFIKKYLTCIILLYNDTCSIFKPECIEVKHFMTDPENHQLFCAALNFFFMWHFTGVHCHYIPPFQEMIRPDCGACLVIPSVGNCRKFLITDLNVYDYVLQYGSYRNRPLCFHPNTSIEWVDFSGNTKHGYPEFHRFFNADLSGLESIRVFNGSRNSLQVLNQNFRKNFPLLQILNASYNLLALDEEKALIGLSKSIEVLDLSHNQIKTLSVDRFADLQELKHLDLSFNFIEDFNVTLSSSKQLEYLDISNNQLRSLPQFTINQLNEIVMVNGSHQLQVNIGSNNLICTCATKDFVRWVLHSHPANLIFIDHNNYICTNRYSNRVELQSITMQMLNFECYETLIYGYVGALSIVLILLMVVAYKRRFYLRHKWYKMNKKLHKRTYSQRSHEYDAFICFDDADSDWINFEAKQHLSQFNIAYGEQDIEPGQHIHQAVYEYIERSYRSILVLSPNFVNSPNSLYHMNIVEEKLKFTGNDILIIVKLKPLNRVGLDRTLKELMEHRLCLEWKKDHKDAQDFFWEKLVDALQAPCEELYDIPDDRTGLIQ